jgi:hypothetical protein
MHALSRNRVLKYSLGGTMDAEDMKLSVVKGMRVETETTVLPRGRLSFDPRKLDIGKRLHWWNIWTLKQKYLPTVLIS